MFVATAHPEKEDKGRWRSMQWSANVTGSAVGAAVALGISLRAMMGGVPDSVYIVFIVLQCCSTSFAMLMQRPEVLRRCHGTVMAECKHISILETLKITGKLFTNWRILVLLPCFSSRKCSSPFRQA